MAAIVLQSFHMVEHTVQVDQHFFQGLSHGDSNGLIDELNVEWVHWIYNAVYFGLLLVLFKKLSIIKLIKDKSIITKTISILFASSVVLQGYHFVEHSVKVIQWINTDCIACSGLSGNFIDGIIFHFTMNILVFIPLLLYLIIMPLKSKNREVIVN